MSGTSGQEYFAAIWLLPCTRCACRTKMVCIAEVASALQENKLGQKFLVDATLFCDLQRAGTSDDLRHTVDYAAVYTQISEILQGKPHKLLESVAESICSRVLNMDARIAAVQVHVCKPHVAVQGPVESLGVEIKRFSKIDRGFSHKSGTG